MNMADKNLSTRKSNTNAKKTPSVTEKKKFKWDMNMVKLMLDTLFEYKSLLEYRNCDFNADKSKQYEALRISLATEYENVDMSFFGPIKLDQDDGEDRGAFLEKNDVQKKQIRVGYNRVMEKVKELRQGFSNAVTAGSRSGSGKLVLEFYDLMVQIWGGAPSTEPLPFGIQSSQAASISSIVVDSEVLHDLSSSDRESEETLARLDQEQCKEQDDQDEDDVDLLGGGPVGETIEKPNVSKRKRRSCQSQVPNLIDDKRKKMERQLSAAQRDKLFLQESKEEKEFRCEMAKAFKESNSIFAESIKAISSSMTALASSMQRSVDMSVNQSRQRAPIPVSQPAMISNVMQHGNYIEHNTIQANHAFMMPDIVDDDRQTFYQF
jgi:hypothetical protein